jgi:MFS family permease
LNKLSPFSRTLFGSLWLAFVFFGLAIGWAIPLYASLFMIGMAKGIIYPSIATLLASITASSRYGRMFSILSIAYSIGAFLGPVLAGQLRAGVSPYFIAFLALMTGLSLLPFERLRRIVSA